MNFEISNNLIKHIKPESNDLIMHKNKTIILYYNLVM